jgi:hypothetical protein
VFEENKANSNFDPEEFELGTGPDEPSPRVVANVPRKRSLTAKSLKCLLSV